MVAWRERVQLAEDADGRPRRVEPETARLDETLVAYLLGYWSTAYTEYSLLSTCHIRLDPGSYDWIQYRRGFGVCVGYSTLRYRKSTSILTMFVCHASLGHAHGSCQRSEHAAGQCVGY